MAEVDAALAVAAGGRLWEGAGMRRMYFDNWPELSGLETVWQPPGRLVSARLWGEEISPTAAKRIMAAVEKVWLDLYTGRIAVYINRRTLAPVDPRPEELKRRITDAVLAAACGGPSSAAPAGTATP